MLGLLVNRQPKSIKADGGRFLEGVLPDADDAPAALAQLTICPFIVPMLSVLFWSQNLWSVLVRV